MSDMSIKKWTWGVERQYLGLDIELKETRQGFVDGLVELAGENENIICLTADLMHATKVDKFAYLFPDRFFNVGIAEQNMMGIAAGLSRCGFIPFVATFAVFATMRACEQVRTDIAYTSSNVKIVGTGGGFSFGIGGVTHSGNEDLGIMRSIPNMTIIIPVDYLEAKKAVAAITKLKGPVYMRIGRTGEPVINKNDYDFSIGESITLKDGEDVCIYAIGPMVYESLVAASILEKDGISVRVVNMHTLKPVDKKEIIDSARSKKMILTVEEHNIIGGLGSAVSEVLSENIFQKIKFKRLGLNDEFITPGKPDELREYYKLKGKYIAECIKNSKEIL